MLGISAQTNETGEERKATVTVSYQDAEDVTLSVTQAFFVNPLAIEVKSVDATGGPV